VRAELIKEIPFLVLPPGLTAGKSLTLESGPANGFKHDG